MLYSLAITKIRNGISIIYAVLLPSCTQASMQVYQWSKCTVLFKQLKMVQLYNESIKNQLTITS